MKTDTFAQTRPLVVLLTDFGEGDGDVGVMKGVIAGITPQAHIIDLTHAVAPQNVASAAWILASAYRYFPAGTVFVCVIDPGVGSSRRLLALHAGDWFFVGPDNGLFSYILQEQTLHGAVTLANPAYRLPQVSSTFHGRDIFAPAGAYLAGQAAVFADLGPALAPEELIRLSTVTATRHEGTVEAHLVHIDNFGNLITGIPLSLVPEFFSASLVRLTFPHQHINIEQRRRFFAAGADDGQPFLFGDSSGYVGVAIRNGNAARSLGIPANAPVILTIS
jgi:S-adenosylmethionine hydrolase